MTIITILVLMGVPAVSAAVVFAMAAYDEAHRVPSDD